MIGTPAACMRSRAAALEPMTSIASAGGPIQVRPAFSTAREGRVLGQEPVAGVDRLGAGALRCVDHSLLGEVALRRRSWAQQVGLVGGTHVERVAIRFRVDGDRRDPELPRCAEDPDRDLATIGD